MSTFFEREAEEYRKYFADHKATWDGRVLNWAKPGTGINSISYILHGCYLFVVGDLCDVIFHWPSRCDVVLKLDFLRGLSHKEMLRKCLASEVGSDFISWDNETAREWLDHELKQDLPLVQRERLTELTFSEMTQDDFSRTAEMLRNDGFDIDTSGAVCNAGRVPHHRFIAQYVGLQMAIEMRCTV